MKIIAGFMFGGVLSLPFFALAIAGGVLGNSGIINEGVETGIAGVALAGVIGCIVYGIRESLRTPEESE